MCGRQLLQVQAGLRLGVVKARSSQEKVTHMSGIREMMGFTELRSIYRSMAVRSEDSTTIEVDGER